MSDKINTTPTAAAISWDATRAALKKGAAWPWVVTALGIASLPLCIAGISWSDPGHPQILRELSGAIKVAAVLMFCVGVIGIVAVWIRRRRIRSLRRYPWVAYPIQYLRPDGNEYIRLLTPHGEALSTLILSSWRWEMGKLANETTREIWFAGDPQRYGIISRPGGGDLRYAYKSEPLPRQPDEPTEGRPRYGRLSDTRYPSPRKLRRTLAFALDLVIHIGCGVAVAVVTAPEFSAAAFRHTNWQHLTVNGLTISVFFLAASFIDRVVIQSIFHTTVGKAVFGLIVLRPDTGLSPSFSRLLAAWLLNIWLPIAVVGDSIGPDHPEDYFFPAVRRRDFRRPIDGI
ncbi:RDD family protein [Nocardia pseudobrasiliensis]|uniref:RDD family protein n=1 Tax=Nocardia pseudobrasiliensis TaxID=45979 RepID=A0A370I116_9NOCA|nr:RDD family protein [Nocardia pseudobrasiliensis]RDI64442.1 RDD family protein [Nocardia pseudobrasiliensis]